jgi:hypothetical protein
VFEAVDAERGFQDRKWGTDPAVDGCILPGEDLHAQNTVLGEEFGEVCKATLEGDRSGRLRELVQVAAVSCAIIQFHYTKEEIDECVVNILQETRRI